MTYVMLMVCGECGIRTLSGGVQLSRLKLYQYTYAAMRDVGFGSPMAMRDVFLFRLHRLETLRLTSGYTGTGVKAVYLLKINQL